MIETIPVQDYIHSLLPSFVAADEKIFKNLAKLTSLKQRKDGSFFLGHWHRGPLLFALAAKYHPKIAVELGTGRGYGCLSLAYAVEHFKLDCSVYSADIRSSRKKTTWPIDLGTGPTLEQQSIDNIWNAHLPRKLTEKIRLNSKGSVKALRHWFKKNDKIDFCFIDADHSYESVKKDFLTCLPLLHEKSVVLFDDYTDRADYGIKAFIDFDLRPVVSPDTLTILDMGSLDETVSGPAAHRMALLKLDPELLVRLRKKFCSLRRVCSYKTFCAEWDDLLRRSNASGLQKKYFSTHAQYKRVAPLVKKAGPYSKLGPGLDFGCGPGIALLLAQQTGICLEGLDVSLQIINQIPHEAQDSGQGENFMPRGPRGFYESLFSLQRGLEQKGFYVRNEDTSKYPWPYPDNTFGFVSASWSITKNVISWNESGEQDVDTFLPERLAEIARILKPHGALFIQGGSGKTAHIEVVKRYGNYIFEQKQIKLIGF